LVIAATIAIATALLLTGTYLAQDAPRVPEPAELAPQAGSPDVQGDKPEPAEQALGADSLDFPGEPDAEPTEIPFPDTIAATVIQVTGADAPWSESITLEMPQLLRDDRTALIRIWFRGPRGLPLEPNQRVEFTRDVPGFASYTLQGEAELVLLWENSAFPADADHGTDEYCAFSPDEPGGVDRFLEIEDLCMTPLLGSTSIPASLFGPEFPADGEPDLFAEEVANLPEPLYERANSAYPVDLEVPGLLVAVVTIYDGPDFEAFSLQVVTSNPEATREALTALTTNSDGTWAPLPATPLIAVPSPADLEEWYPLTR